MDVTGCAARATGGGLVRVLVVEDEEVLADSIARGLRWEGMAVDVALDGAEELLERVWDEHADPFTNAVRMTMTKLRRKLGDPPVIETVIGQGYRIV
jgi:DNA-binding response OmpR family regulator